MKFEIDNPFDNVAKMKVIGVGGAGGNAVNRMVQTGLDGVEFIVVNTDAMALNNNLAEIRLQIGEKLTGGLGAGADPNIGAKAMEEDRDKVRAHLEGADMIFIAAGMGGGTGTGAAPVVAEIARELGILSIGVVTKPFKFEGPIRERHAMAGLDVLRKVVDTVIVIPNQKLLTIIEKTTTFREAFRLADEVLTSATKGISEIILKHGDIQVDFADVETIMKQGGDALMGSGTASGENRAVEAADRAIHSPLLEEVSISGATGALVNITGSENLGMLEINDAMQFIYESIGTESHSNIIFGTVIDPEMKDELSITVIATGFGNKTSLNSFTRGLNDIGREQQLQRITERDVRIMPFQPKPSVIKENVVEKKIVEAKAEKEPETQPQEAPPKEESIPTIRYPQSTYGEGSYKPENKEIDYEYPAFLRNGQGMNGS